MTDAPDKHERRFPTLAVVLWLTVEVGLALGWWVDRGQIAKELSLQMAAMKLSQAAAEAEQAKYQKLIEGVLRLERELSKAARSDKL